MTRLVFNILYFQKFNLKFNMTIQQLSLVEIRFVIRLDIRTFVMYYLTDFKRLKDLILQV